MSLNFINNIGVNMDRDLKLDNSLRKLKIIAHENHNNEIKECALDLANRVEFISNKIYKETNTSNESFYNAAKGELELLSQFIQCTNDLLGVPRPTRSMVEAYRAVANQAVDRIAENEKQWGRNGIAGTTILTLLVSILQNVPANTNPKIKWCLIGLGSAGVIGLGVATTFFLHGDKTELKALMIKLSNAVLKIIDVNYGDKNEFLLEPSQHLRNSFLKHLNSTAKDEVAHNEDNACGYDEEKEQTSLSLG